VPAADVVNSCVVVVPVDVLQLNASDRWKRENFSSSDKTHYRWRPREILTDISAVSEYLRPGPAQPAGI